MRLIFLKSYCIFPSGPTARVSLIVTHRAILRLFSVFSEQRAVSITYGVSAAVAMINTP